MVRLDQIAKSGMDFPLRFPTYKWTKPANWLSGLAAAAYGNCNTEAFECILNKTHLKGFKKFVSSNLTKAEWVSTYEATFAALLAAKAIAMGKSGFIKDKEAFARALRVTAVVNTRGKIPGYTPLFFGNCFTHVEVQLELDDGFMSQPPLAVAVRIAEQLHEALLRAKTDPRELAKLHLWANASQERKEADRIEMDCLRDWSLERNLMVNDWILSKLDCGLDMDMGTGERPVLFAWPTKALPKNLFNLIPRDNHNNTLALRLPQRMAEGFFGALEHMHFPIELIN